MTQIASQRTVPLCVTVMKYNYQQDLLKNSSTAPLPSKQSRGRRRKKKNNQNTKQVITDKTSFTTSFFFISSS